MEPSDIKTQVLTQTPSDTAGMAPDVAAALASRYEILDPLGDGGMGLVYRARDRETGEVLALKLLRPEIARDPAMMERFKNELRLARRITHKNVCRIYDFNRVGDVASITMEYVDGESLRAYLKRAGRLTPERTIDLARQISSGLGEAHAQGVVHRDLKPENVMLARDGLVKIMDFGIARALGGDATTTRTIVGTPEYMAPEQSQGRNIDQRADLYALGLILYECLTGRRAFSGATPVEVALKQLKERPVPPRKFLAATPPHLEAIVMRCLEKEPARRYASVSELQRALTPSLAMPRRAPGWRLRAAVFASVAVLTFVFAHKTMRHAGSSPPPTTLARVAAPAAAGETRLPPLTVRRPDGVRQDDATVREGGNPIYLDMRQDTRDRRESLFLIQRAARHGNPRAQFALAEMYEQGRGVARDPVEAYAWYKRAAALGYEQAYQAIQRLKPVLTDGDIAVAERRASRR